MIGASLLSVACVLLPLAIFFWRANTTSPAHRWFAFFALSVAGWTIGVSGLYWGNHLDVWARVAFASASVIPASAFGFIYAYPNAAPWPRRTLLRVLLVTGGALATTSIATPLVVAETIVMESGIWRRPGALYPVFAMNFLATWALALGLFAQKWRMARGHARAQLRYVGAAIVL